MTTAYDQSNAHSEESRRVILATFAYLGVPRSMIDLGCGPGHMCDVAAGLDVDALGYDIGLEQSFWADNLYLTKEDFLTAGLRPRDLAVCLEVAEHIEESKADLLIDRLVQATGKTLLFSAAVPGQGGCGHVNEQPHEYWRKKLRAKGLVEDLKATGALRRIFSEVAPNAWWYGQNVMVFRSDAQ